jgi:protein arginine N-methyltransferase 5
MNYLLNVLTGHKDYLKVLNDNVDNGISIPQQYSAFVAPLSSATLYHRARELGQEKYLETPYVVRFQSVYEIAEPKPIWAFDHPNKTKRNPMGHPDFNSHNTRQWKGSFHAAVDVAMHGFAGYFECILYKDVVMSINPATHSPNMTSWFSMYFPLKSPIHVPKDAVISTQFWRRSASQKVWYEWSVSIKLNGVDIYYSDIHNKQGCSSSFLL